jgi:hypothetical protein
MKKDGTIKLKGKDITIEGSGVIRTKAQIRSVHTSAGDMDIKGAMVKINT